MKDLVEAAMEAGRGIDAGVDEEVISACQRAFTGAASIIVRKRSKSSTSSTPNRSSPWR
jgi:hypothetical protein